jgi:hypothetical protein
MIDLFQLILDVVASLFKSRARLEAEILVQCAAPANAEGRRAHFFEPFSTKTVSQNQPLETAASKPVETPKSVSGDWLPPPK